MKVFLQVILHLKVRCGLDADTLSVNVIFIQNVTKMYQRRCAANKKLPGHCNGSTSICKCKIRHCLTAVKRMRRYKGLLWTRELHKLIKCVKILKAYHTVFLTVLFSSLKKLTYIPALTNYNTVSTSVPDGRSYTFGFVSALFRLQASDRPLYNAKAV